MKMMNLLSHNFVTLNQKSLTNVFFYTRKIKTGIYYKIVNVNIDIPLTGNDNTFKYSKTYLDHEVICDSTIYNTDVFDAAERSRFYIVDMKASNKDSLDYLIKQYKGDLAVEDDPEEIQRIKGRLNLAMTLLKSKQFVFDDDQDEAIAQENQTNILNPRSLTQALDMSDGTKKDFLDWWNGMCNPTKRGVMETILSNYKDVDNKANSVFKNKQQDSEGEDSSIFKKKEPSAYDKFSDWKKNNGY